MNETTGSAPQQAEPAPIATLPPLPVLRNEYPRSPRTGEPVRPALVLVAMVALLLAASGVAVTYALHWWAAVHPATYPTSARLIRWVQPDPGKWLSLTLEVVLAVVVAVVAGFSGYVGHHAWNGWRWTRWGALVALALNGAVAALFSWWGLIGVGFAVAASALLFTPRVTEFFRQFEAHRAHRPLGYRRPERVFYGRLPRFR